MADVFTVRKRSIIMGRIRSKHTAPEMLVRSLTWRMGYRFRLHVSALPGKPDLVFPSRSKLIFVNGCFWHMHMCNRGRSTPVSNFQFWKTKRNGTRLRDRRNHARLRLAGWKILTLWECQLRDPEKVAERIRRFLADDRS